jgi:copper chaperone CopZ
MKKTVTLHDLDCANCAAKIESAIGKLEGVAAVTVNFLRQKMDLEAPDDKFESVLDSAVKIIKKIEPDVTVEL